MAAAWRAADGRAGTCVNRSHDLMVEQLEQEFAVLKDKVRELREYL